MVVTLVTGKNPGFWGLAGTVALAWVAGCGGVEARPRHEGTAGAHDGSAAAGGEPSAPDAPTLEVHETELAPGTCGVVRRIRLPRDTQSSYGTDPAFARQMGGFSVGPWNSGDDASVVNALWLDPALRTFSSFEASGSSNDNHWSMFLGSTRTAVEVYISGLAHPSDGSYANTFATRTWTSGQTQPTEYDPLLTAAWRGTDYLIGMPALSGEAAVFAIWPIALSEPRAALIDSRGAPLREARSLAPEDHQFARCPAVTPTEHGGIVSFIDDDLESGADVLRVVELGKEPATLDVTLPVAGHDGACPIVAYDGNGLALLLPGIPTAGPATVRYVATGRSTESTVSLSGQPMAFTELQGAPLVLERQAHGAVLEWLTSPTPIRADVPPDIQAFHPIPGEPGKLFLHSLPLDGPREIVELTCR